MNNIGNPFPGLRPFKSEESYLFFGRDGQSDELLDRLARNRFLAVVGTSGSGKSSLVRAGLLPTVHGGFMAEAGSHWRVVILRPGDNPIGNLTKELSKPGVFKDINSLEKDYNISDQTVETEVALRRGSLGLVEVFRQSRLPKTENLLLVVDQFEELFRFKESALIENASDEAAAFVKLLLKSVEQKEVPIYVVITMRSEFLGDCAQFRDLPETINNSQYLIPRMTRELRRQAITGPVAVAGAHISPRLVQRLLNDVGDNPDQLPILQHALMRTWDYWDKEHKKDEPLDLKHYEDIGTMERALSRHAEESYAELKTKTSLAICEKMFKLLTQTGEKGRSIRRLAKVSEICLVTDSSEKEVIEVIDVFRQAGRTFIMPPIEEKLKADSVIDVSHESLMRIWNRLIRWATEEVKSAEIYLQMAKAAALYELGKTSLWRDPDLMLALRWRENNKPNAAWAERYDPSFEQAISFLENSKKQQEQEIEEKEKQREREIKNREKIRELEIKRKEEQIRRKRTIVFSIVITIAAVISILLAYVAWDKKLEADELRKKAEIEKNEADKLRKIAVYLRKNEKKLRIKAEGLQKEEEQQRKISEKSALVAEENEIMEKIQGLTAGMNKAEATFREYLAKAKELAIQSIVETKNIELKSQLALKAYDWNNKAYDDLRESTRSTFEKFDEKKSEEFDRHEEPVEKNKKLSGEYDKSKRVYKSLQKKSTEKYVPAEIFEALRKAYISTNEDSKDILAHAESWAMAVINNNNIVFNNMEGELLLASLQLNSNDSKLPVLKKKDIDSSKNPMFIASSFAETKDHLFCGTRDGSIICWEKNNWAEKRLPARYQARILSMSFSKNNNSLFYSVKNKIYTHNIRSNSKDTGNTAFQFEEDNFIQMLTVIEDDKNSFLIAADERGKVFLFKLNRGGDIVNVEKKKPLFKDRNNSTFHSIAYHPEKKLLILGNSSGEIFSFPNIDCNYLNSNPAMKSKTYYMHKGIVRALAFSPGGKYLASGGLDGTIRLWDLEGKKAEEVEWQTPILTINSKLKILSIAFSMEEDYMIFSDEKSLRICPTSPEIFYVKLGNKRKDNELKKKKITREEWKQYIGETINQDNFIVCSKKKGE